MANAGFRRVRTVQHWRYLHAVVVALCGVVLVGATLATSQLLISPRAGADSPAPSWYVQSSYPQAVSGVGLTCPTLTECVGFGGTLSATGESGVAVSQDGGATWGPGSLPGSGLIIDGVSCPDALHCVAVGASNSVPIQGIVVTTDDGGSTWAEEPSLSVESGLTAVSCDSVTHCVALGAVGEVILVTDDGGASWATELDRGVPTDDLSSLSCPTAQRCVAVGESGVGVGPLAPIALWSDDGGVTWASASVPAAGLPFDVSCSSATRCVSVGESVMTSDDGGRSWSQAASVPADASTLGSVSCVATTCTAVGELQAPPSPAAAAPEEPAYVISQGPMVVVSSHDGGVDWSDERAPPFEGGGALSCPSTTSCLIGSEGEVARSDDGGSTWRTSSLPSTPGTLPAVSCGSASFCVAVGNGILSTTDGGASWVPGPAQPASVDLSGVWCDGAGDCLAVGGLVTVPSDLFSPVVGVAMTTDDFGASWTRLPLPPGTTGLNAISCTSRLDCTVVGQPTDEGPPILATTDGGHSWISQATPVGADTILSSISCPSVDDCDAVGSGAFGGVAISTTDGGASWAEDTIPTSLSLSAVSCSSTCVAIGVLSGGAPQILTSPSVGAGFTAEIVPAGVAYLRAVQCATASACYAVGGSATGAAAVSSGDGGDTWATMNVPSPSGAMAAVSCTSDTTCVATGYDEGGNVATFSTVAPTIGPLTVSATVTPSTATAGQSVTFSARVSQPFNLPTGLVTFSVGDTLLCSAGLFATSTSSAAGSCPSSAAPVGTHTVVATFEDSGAGYPIGTTQLTVTAQPAVAHGYWLTAGDGGVFAFGGARYHGSTGDLALLRPVVGMTPTSDRRGYWMVATDGGVFGFGDARYLGSVPGLGIAPAGSSAPGHLNAPIVAIVASAGGRGYLLVGADGGVFAFGDATYHGSCPAIGGCNGAVVAVVPDAGGGGYWVVTATGHVYPFGDAPHLGQATATPAPVTGAVASPSGNGYLLVNALGDVYGFGDGSSLGLPPAQPVAPITGVVATSTGAGYWLTGATGAVYPYGDAVDDGSMLGRPLNAPIVTAAGF